MWKAYVDKGVAIQTNFERMQAKFKGTRLTVVESVAKHVNFERDQIGLGHAFTHFTTKDLPCED